MAASFAHTPDGASTWPANERVLARLSAGPASATARCARSTASTWTLRGGEVLALLGAQRRGQDHRDRPAARLAAADSGTVELFGQRPQRLAARRRIGVMLQDAGIAGDACASANCSSSRAATTRRRAASPNARRWPALDGLLERRYGRLSGGQQRRVQFALAMCGRPQLLFLDEPTTGLDIEARQGLWRAIRELVARRQRCLLTTHYLEEAEALADRVVRDGDAAAWSPQAASMQVRARVSQRRVRCATRLPAEIVAAWPRRAQRVREGDRLCISHRAAEAGGAAPARTRCRTAATWKSARRPGRSVHRTHPRRCRRTR